MPLRGTSAPRLRRGAFKLLAKGQTLQATAEAGAAKELIAAGLLPRILAPPHSAWVWFLVPLKCLFNQPPVTNSELAGCFEPANVRNLLPARIASQIQATVIPRVMELSQRTPIRMKAAETKVAAPLASR